MRFTYILWILIALSFLLYFPIQCLARFLFGTPLESCFAAPQECTTSSSCLLRRSTDESRSRSLSHTEIKREDGGRGGPCPYQWRGCLRHAQPEIAPVGAAPPEAVVKRPQEARINLLFIFITTIPHSHYLLQELSTFTRLYHNFFKSAVSGAFTCSTSIPNLIDYMQSNHNHTCILLTVGRRDLSRSMAAMSTSPSYFSPCTSCIRYNRRSSSLACGEGKQRI